MNDMLMVWFVAVLLPVVGMLVFARVSRDYRRHGRLTKLSTALQTGLFVLHGASSFVFLNSHPGAIDIGNPLFGFALVLIGGGIVLLLSTIGRFGAKRALGHDSSSLTCSGMYRKSRNPQVMFYGIVVAGYSLLWPSWTGAIWVVLYAVLAHMMVHTEEAHLKKAYGAEYVDYCAHTPRYMDLPGMK